MELFDVFYSVSCALYGILDTRNINLPLRDLLGVQGKKEHTRDQELVS